MNVRKIDFGTGRDWAAHAQDHWLEFAGNPNFPDYLRVMFVAYGRHKANGHAKLSRGELARYLVRKDGTLPERRVTWRAIEKAIQLGYLEAQSRQLCLVVGSHHVQGGRGNANDPCPRDHTRRGQSVVGHERRWTPNVVDDARRSSGNVVDDARRSSGNVVDDERRSRLSSSLLSHTSTGDDRETADRIGDAS